VTLDVGNVKPGKGNAIQIKLKEEEGKINHQSENEN
jgi:hypothetical protein